MWDLSDVVTCVKKLDSLVHTYSLICYSLQPFGVGDTHFANEDVK